MNPTYQKLVDFDCTQILHAWNMYLHLVDFDGVNGGTNTVH